MTASRTASSVTLVDDHWLCIDSLWLGERQVGYRSLAHRLDEFPGWLFLAGCPPALPASASPAAADCGSTIDGLQELYPALSSCGLLWCGQPGGSSVQETRSRRRIKWPVLPRPQMAGFEVITEGSIAESAIPIQPGKFCCPSIRRVFESATTTSFGGLECCFSCEILRRAENTASRLFGLSAAFVRSEINSRSCWASAASRPMVSVFASGTSVESIAAWKSGSRFRLGVGL